MSTNSFGGQNITILKIGGSVITDKNADENFAKHDEIDRISKEISEFDGRLVIVHGAGSFGHPQAKKYQITDKFDAKGSIITHKSVNLLNQLFIDSLIDNNVNAVSVHPMNNTISKNGRIQDMFLDNLYYMLDNKIVPVLHGDVVMDKNTGTSIISGDQIVPYLATQMGAIRIGIGSIKEGVLDENGKTLKLITHDNFANVKNNIGSSEGTDVTGGMLGKVTELLKLNELTGSTSYIFNAGKPGNVSMFLQGNDIGTSITGSGQ